MFVKGSRVRYDLPPRRSIHRRAAAAVLSPVAQVETNGPNAAPLFQHLKAALPDAPVPQAPWAPRAEASDVQWNFTKWLVINGRVVRRYSFDVDPAAIEADITAALSDATDEL
jgi:glutathione peroxidase-family protein